MSWLDSSRVLWIVWGIYALSIVGMFLLFDIFDLPAHMVKWGYL
jgi:hypothetical protein